MRNWKEKHISETGNRSMAFRDQKNWDKRTPEEMARLDFLRRKQQPEVDWDVDWEHFYLPDDISADCVFQAKKVTYLTNDSVLDQGSMGTGIVKDPAPYWTSYRLKAVLRSGKSLPGSILTKIGPKSQWKTISRWIEEAGELPGVDQIVLSAVYEVQNEGYGDALAEIMRGDIADQKDRGGQSRQNRALDLVSTILNAWEDRDRRTPGDFKVIQT